MEHPGGTLPDKLGGKWADTNALYRLAANPKVTHQAVIESHCQRTLELAGGHPVVLFLHDSTELDFTYLESMRDEIGQIGNGGGRGYICHNTLAVTPGREVIGLASQVLHQRRKVSKRESPKAKREHPGRESLLWLKGTEAVGRAPAGPGGGGESAQSLWVNICDRGADTFEFLDHQRVQGSKYVVRAAKDRRLAGDDHIGADRVHQTLMGYTRDLPSLGEREIEVPRRQKGRRQGERQARTARVSIAAGPVSVAVPHFCRGNCSAESLDMWVVHVRETDPPAGSEAIEWILLTNVPVTDFASACERVEWYGCRWVIEELHKGQKTGCGIEELQFEYPERLEPVVGLLSVVAVELLRLREMARGKDADITPAGTMIDGLSVEVMSRQRYGQTRKPADMTVREFAMALARLGGHLNRKADGFPGWLTTWRGWQKLRMMIAGAETARCV